MPAVGGVLVEEEEACCCWLAVDPWRSEVLAGWLGWPSGGSYATCLAACS